MNSAEVAGASASQLTIQLTPVDNSGIDGTATLSDLGGGRTHVQLLITGSNGDHPAHIHDGQCPDVNPAPKYPLTDVQNGSSVTDINASLDDLLSAPMGINVHMNPNDDTAVACGNIQRG